MEKTYSTREHLNLAVRRSILSAALRNLDLPEVVGIALRGMNEVMGAGSSAAFVTDEDTGRLRLVAQLGMPEGFLRWLSRTGGTESVFSRVLASGRAAVVAHLEEDRELAPLFKKVRGATCLVAFPLSSPSGNVGLVAAACSHKQEMEPEEQDMLEALGEDLGMAVASIHTNDNLRQAFLSTIRAMAAAIDARDFYDTGHSDKVVAIAVAIAEQMGLDGEIISGIRDAGYLHDVGKIVMPESVLGKDGPLSDEEMAAIRLHPGMGHQLMDDARIPAAVKDMIRHHHERFDGAGYPDELAGGSIPLGSRILCVADAFEAMVSDRPHRPRLSEEEALDELKRWSGKQFDPEVVEAFIQIKDRLTCE